MLQLRGRPVGPGGPPHAHSAADDLEKGRVLPGLSAPASGRWPFEVAPSRWRLRPWLLLIGFAQVIEGVEELR